MRASDELPAIPAHFAIPIPGNYCDVLNDDVPIVRRPICSMMR